MLHSDWEHNVLGVYNYKKPGKLDQFYAFLRANADRLEGDVAEAGCFQGRSLLATALLLRELGSDKLVYGYDTFTGFPPVYHANDDFAAFVRLREEGRIGEEHWEQVQRLRQYKTALAPTAANTARDISTSGDFSGTSLDLLRRKIELLGLTNIRLVQGPFTETMRPDAARPAKLMAALVDCDLYESYNACLPFFWERAVAGGYLFLDEYYSLKFPGGRIATDEFFAARGEKPFRHPPVPGDFERWGVIKT